MRHWKNISIALFAALLLAVPAFAGVCDTYDDGSLRPATDPNPDVACGGPGFTPPGEVPQGGGSLTTLFASDNQFAGNTFDVVATTAMTITGFDVNLVTGSSTTIAIYWRPGTSVGFQDSSAGWTLLGTDTVTPGGQDVPTFVNIGGLALTPGNTYGFYVDLQSYPSTSMRYTNGGPNTYSNADLSITTQFGKGDPAFTGGSFFPRQWNGTIYYDIVDFEYPLIQEIPTLSKAGVAALLALLAVAAVFVLRRR